jgi:hypothetical protein
MEKADRSMYKAGYTQYLDSHAASGARMAGLAVLRDMFGEGHQAYLDFKSMTEGRSPLGFSGAKAVLEVALDHLKNGWLGSISGVVAGELFSDFLEMAQHLSEETYKDAAAVIAGSSLEAHLKRVAVLANVPLSYVDAKGATRVKRADTLNTDLAKADVYDLNEQKQVTAWLGIRNDAAHGDYGKVNADMVALMISGIRQFIARYPA